MRQGLVFERLVLFEKAPWVKPPAWPVFCWWLWDASGVVLSEQGFWRQGQDNDLAMICFCFLFSVLGSAPELKHVCYVLKPTAGPIKILCSNWEVVVVTRHIGTSDTAFFPPHSGDCLGLNAKGRRKEAVCGYLEKMETRPKPAVTAVVKSDTRRLCCT